MIGTGYGRGVKAKLPSTVYTALWSSTPPHYRAPARGTAGLMPRPPAPPLTRPAPVSFAGVRA
ncbi:MAG: hypothetical protein JWO42_1358 [Chloroflexi bacterium]|nr:hypothetical protein [Chloroflexota bacterium]